MDEHGEAGRLGKDLAQLRMNLHLLEEDLRAVETHNRKEVISRQQDQKLVGLKKEELVALKGRINSLLKEEKNKLRDLNVSLVRAEAALLTHERSIHDSETKRKRAESTSFDVHREYLEKNMRHHSHARTEDARIQDAHQRIKLESKVRNMQNALKAKMYEVATQQASKGHQLLRRVMTGRRIEKEKKQTKKVLKGAEYLLNYSVDIEKVIKSNIEIANELKKHYERLSELQEVKSNQGSNMQDVSANSLPQIGPHIYHNNPATMTAPDLPSLYQGQKPVLPQSPPSAVTDAHQLQPAVYGASTYHRYHLDTAQLRSQPSQRSGLHNAAGYAPSRKLTAISGRNTQLATEPQTSAERSAGSQGQRSARFSNLSTLNPLPSTAGGANNQSHNSSLHAMPRYQYQPLPLLPSVSPSRIVGAPPGPHPHTTHQIHPTAAESRKPISHVPSRITPPRPPQKKGLSPEPVVPQIIGNDIMGGQTSTYHEHERSAPHAASGKSNGLREALMMGVKGLDPINARGNMTDHNALNMHRIQSGDSLQEAKHQAQIGNDLANALRKMAGLG